MSKFDSFRYLGSGVWKVSIFTAKGMSVRKNVSFTPPCVKISWACGLQVGRLGRKVTKIVYLHIAPAEVPTDPTDTNVWSRDPFWKVHSQWRSQRGHGCMSLVTHVPRGSWNVEVARKVAYCVDHWGGYVLVYLMTTSQWMEIFHLNEYFADVFALRHEPECSLYVVSFKHSRLQWLHCAVLDPLWHQIVNSFHVRISRLKERIEQDAVKWYVAQKYCRAYKIECTIQQTRMLHTEKLLPIRTYYYILHCRYRRGDKE